MLWYHWWWRAWPIRMHFAWVQYRIILHCNTTFLGGKDSLNTIQYLYNISLQDVYKSRSFLRNSRTVHVHHGHWTCKSRSEVCKLKMRYLHRAHIMSWYNYLVWVNKIFTNMTVWSLNTHWISLILSSHVVLRVADWRCWVGECSCCGSAVDEAVVGCMPGPSLGSPWPILVLVLCCCCSLRTFSCWGEVGLSLISDITTFSLVSTSDSEEDLRRLRLS